MKNFMLKLQILKDQKGQDLIEYALMAGFVAVAAVIIKGALVIVPAAVAGEVETT